MIFAFQIFLLCTSCATTVEAGSSIQVALDAAVPGDTIVVMAGQYEPFVVERSVTLQGVGRPEISSHVQTPGITVRAERANITGFKILGVPKDPTAKYSYFLESPSLTVLPEILALDLPNAGILVEADLVAIEDTAVYGAEVGILVEDGDLIVLRNDTFYGCGHGIELQGSDHNLIELCQFLDNDKYGIFLENSSYAKLWNNNLTGTKNVGAMLKNSSGCAIEDSFFSTNWMGLVLWSSSNNRVQGNNANQNYYYGMLITSQSNNNTIIENNARENGGGAVSLFGIGISLQESFYNAILRNTLDKNFNGMELIDGSGWNVVSCNNISGNRNGIRLDKTHNNLIFRNNFERNFISASDNDSHNFWNTSVGNYFSDYSGSDDDCDGRGDQPYWIPKGSSCVADWHPLTAQDSCEVPDLEMLREDLLQYAIYSLKEDQPYSVEGGTIVIESRPPRSWGL
jgi:nitrous oxidase accessory protein